MKIVYAHKVIAETANTKINDGDTIMTFGYSDVVEGILSTAHADGKSNLKVVIVDAQPRMEGT